MAALVTIYDAESRLGVEIATPNFIGYLKHSETGVIIGFVRESVESSHLGATLARMPAATMPLDTRQKWVDQTQDTMEDFHIIRLFRGDCKPAKVIVDKQKTFGS